MPKYCLAFKGEYSAEIDLDIIEAESPRDAIFNWLSQDESIDIRDIQGLSLQELQRFCLMTGDMINVVEI